MTAVSKGQWLKLPDVINVEKVQVALDVSAGNRKKTDAYIKAVIEFSHDGINVATDTERYGFEWYGHNKATKPGWPTTGPAVRIDNFRQDGNGNRIDQNWMGGLYVRLMSDSSVPFNIDVTEVA